MGWKEVYDQIKTSYQTSYNIFNALVLKWFHNVSVKGCVFPAADV